MENETTNMITEATLITLLTDKKECELKAFQLGAAQAMQLFNEDPSYETLCMLVDFSQNWFTDTEEPVDVNYINTDVLPSALICHVITGFYTTVVDIKKALNEVQS